MQYDTPLHTSSSAATISELPWREQLKRGFKDMGARSFSSAKNFGKVGAIFAGTECCIEGFRAKNDLKNGVIAGCITGGVLAAPAGPQAVLQPAVVGIKIRVARFDWISVMPTRVSVSRAEAVSLQY